MAALAMAALAGCGGQAGAVAPKPTNTAAATAVATAAAISTPTPGAPIATATAGVTASPVVRPSATRAARSTATATAVEATVVATATPVVAAQPPRLNLVSVRPLSVATAGALNFSVQTGGQVTRVELYLGSGEPNAPSPLTFALAQGAAGAWTGTGSAPSVGGTYHFTVGLFSASGRRFLEDNDAWNVTVHGSGGSTAPSGNAGAVQPLFADIPLSPPFSYGNPVQAVFSAKGSVVNGSEVVSNTRTDVPAATVAQYYSVHFPRAGWSTSGATVPAGGTSFSLSATSGARVCIVQFSGGTIHIFYGSA